MERLHSNGIATHPPAAYRILNFLEEHGLIHRIASLRAYAACKCDHGTGQCALLICRSCHGVDEVSLANDSRSVIDLAEATGFHVEQTVVEMEGLCPACS